MIPMQPALSVPRIQANPARHFSVSKRMHLWMFKSPLPARPSRAANFWSGPRPDSCRQVCATPLPSQACGCPRPTPLPATMAPTSSPRPTVTAAPTFGADDDDGACQFCPVAHPDATVQLLGLAYPCRQIVNEARRLEPDLCRHAQPLVERDCGCATEAPVVLAPPPPPTRTIPLSPLAAPGVQPPMAARSPVAPPFTVNPTVDEFIFGRSWSGKAAAPHAVHCLLLTLLFVLGA